MLGHGARRSQSGVWDSMEKSRNLVYPTMLQKAKGVTGFLAEMSEKAGPLNTVAYMILRGVGARKKGGSPKMQGYPTICMKIKGKKNSYRGYPTMFMKTGNLTVLTDDIDENKPFNTPSALAQRVTRTCLVGPRCVLNASRKAADIKEMLKMKVAPNG